MFRKKNNKTTWLRVMLFWLVILLVGEVFFRAFFPEYQGHITTRESAYGKIKRTVDCYGFEMRSRNKDECLTGLNPGDIVVILSGDSVGNGYGLAYDDIFWRYWQQYYELAKSPVKIFHIPRGGNNYIDNTENIIKASRFLSAKKVKIAGIIYQFNLNDIVPYTKKDIRQLKHLEEKNSYITKITMAMVGIRLKYLNHSVMFRVISNFSARIFFDNKEIPCDQLGLEGLDSYTYAFGAQGSEEISKQIWQDFYHQMGRIKDSNKNIPFFILFTPIAQFIEPEMKVHTYSRPLRLECATIDPVKKLAAIASDLKIGFIDPSPYMKTAFENYQQDGNPESFYHFNDHNHFNATGSRYFAEYSFFEILDKITAVVPDK